MNFYVGICDIANARHFEKCFISVNRLRKRKSDFQVGQWIMDSGAFTELSIHGKYRHGPEEYAGQVNRWRRCGNFECAVSQDFMCEPFILAKTGLSLLDHQRLTIIRYDAICAFADGTIMPVLQGFEPNDYVRHLADYGTRLKPGMRVGVGSVCKRQSHPALIAYILRLIKGLRPDLRLHGFGVKLTALKRPDIRSLLHSADSMAWSFSARKQGRNANDWTEAKAFAQKIYDYGKPVTLCFEV